MRTSVIRRFGSLIIDSFVLLLLSLPFIPIFVKITTDFEYSGLFIKRGSFIIEQTPFFEAYQSYLIKLIGWPLVFSLVTIILYYILLPMYWDGYTVGRKLCGIKVKSQDKEKLKFGQMFLREVVFKRLWWSVTLGVGMAIDFFMVVLRDDKQTIRDIITNTEVIENHGESVKKEYLDY